MRERSYKSMPARELKASFTRKLRRFAAGGIGIRLNWDGASAVHNRIDLAA